ncbi:ATP-grasp domain-containing protein [Streptomyces avermitilis]|uniref:ATP-grasp domain-containing protein n=1 Tax=Streptomyces avermitilis TaxID=33903 RepID=UPI0033ED258C
MPTSKPLILLGAGVSAAYCEFTLGQIAAAHPVVLVDTHAPQWARPYVVRHLTADPADNVATASVVRNYAAKHELGGVLTYIERYLVTATRITQLLQLPGAPVEALAACSDRATLRRLLTQHTVPLPRWAEACDAQSAAAHADVLGYPVILKPLTGTASSAIQARSREEVSAAYDRVIRHAERGRLSTSGRVLVEDDLDGPDICAETVVLDGGDIRIAAITRTTVGPPPARQALRHCVYAHDGLLHNPVLRHVVTRTVRAIGFTLGVLHIGMKLTTRGPRVTDVSAHLADDLIPLLVKRATGIDLPRAAADLATGCPPDLSPSRQRAAAVNFAYPASTGRIEHLEVASEAARQPLVDRVVPTQKTGQEVVATPYAEVDDRLAHWVVLGADAAGCHATLDRMPRHLTVAITAPLVSSQSV